MSLSIACTQLDYEVLDVGYLGREADVVGAGGAIDVHELPRYRF